MEQGNSKKGAGSGFSTFPDLYKIYFLSKHIFILGLPLSYLINCVHILNLINSSQVMGHTRLYEKELSYTENVNDLEYVYV